MRVTRRNLLAGAAGAVMLGKTTRAQTWATIDPSKVRGTPPSALGQRARAESVQRLARGPGTAIYHMNPITGWVVQATGKVIYQQEAWG